MASAKGYLARGSIQRFRRYLETGKELGTCWFKSNNGRQQAGSVNTFIDSGLKKCGVLSKGFLTSKSKPVYRSNNSMVETAVYRRMLVRIQLEREIKV